MRPAVLAAIATLGATAAAIPAHAMSLRTEVSSRRVGVGQSFRLQLSAMADSGSATPTSPRLAVPPGIAASPPSVTTQQQVSIANGRIQQRQGITVTWTLRASRTGTFRIGPPTVQVGSSRMSGQSVTVQVVPAGSAPPSGGMGLGTSPGWPFGGPNPFGSLPGFSFNFGNGNDQLDMLPNYPDELKMAHPLDPIAFLRATVKPKHVVVGQQVTLDIYAYGHRGPFREVNTSEPSKSDFLSWSIIDNSYGQRQYQVPIDGSVWNAMKIRELALFPIRAGTLTIGPMTMGFDGRGYPAQGQNLGLVRRSRPIEVIVGEPPVQGRPAGYRIGDVGHFSLSAHVEPRALTQGDAVSVVVKLQGTGNLPYKLRTPEQRGVDFLQPSTVDKIGPQGSTIGGWRKFTYVVNIDRAGRVDLGSIRLPYWDPDKNSYEVAAANLGSIQVKRNGNAQAKSTQPDSDDPLANLLTLRTTLGAPAVKPLYVADRPWFWALLFAGPVGVFAISGVVALGRGIGRKVRERREAHGTLANHALSEARQAAATGDIGRAASATERALFTAIEGTSGLKARAVLRDELPDALRKAGINDEMCDRITSLLDECDAVRFTGSPDGSPAELPERAAEVVKQLLRRSHRTSRGDA